MTTLSQQMSELTGIPVLTDLEESSRGKCWHTKAEDGSLVKHTEGFANPPTEYARPPELTLALKGETVTGLYFHYGQCCLVLQTTKGRRVGIPVISFRHPLAEVIQTETGPKLGVRTYVEFVANLIKTRKPN